VKPHYEPHPIVLVRLACVTREALEDLLRGAHRVLAADGPRADAPRNGDAECELNSIGVE